MISTAPSCQALYLSRQFLARSKAMHLLVFLTLCVGAGLFSVHQGTDANFDLKNYHLYNAFAFLENRLFFDVAPADQQSFLNPLADLPYYWLVVWFNDSPRWVAFVQGLPAGIYAYLTLRISLLVAWLVLGQGVIPVACALLAALLGLTGAGFVPLIGTTTNDITVGALVLASLLILLVSLRAQAAALAICRRGFVWQEVPWG